MLKPAIEQIVILGGHGDGLVAAQIIRDLRERGRSIELIGFLNDHTAAGDTIGGYPVLGKTTDWRELDRAVKFHFCLLSVGKMEPRAALIRSFNIPDARICSLIHPTACVADNVGVGAGTLIAAYAVLQPGSRVGRFCSIRAGANLGHDVQLADFAYVGPNATICGYGTLAEGAYVAPNAVVRDSTHLQEYAVLGAGSVAFKDLPPRSTWIGNPARRAV